MVPYKLLQAVLNEVNDALLALMQAFKNWYSMSKAIVLLILQLS
jgi:hypothetical protein